MAFAGTVACLLAAGSWAVAVLWFRGAIGDLGPWTVNLAKCLLATVLLALTVVFSGQLAVLLTAPLVALAWIAVSGLVGMTLGDTALFAAVPHLGVHRTLLLQTLNPLFTALGAFLLLGEGIAASTVAGGATVLAGVALVVAAGRGSEGASGEGSKRLAWGVAWALVAAFGQGFGVVLAKIGMESVPFLSAALVRLATATLGLLVVLALGRGLAWASPKPGRGLAWASHKPSAARSQGTASPASESGFGSSTDRESASGPLPAPSLDPRHLATARREVCEKPRLGRHFGPLMVAGTWRRLAGPSFLGTYLAILLMMAGIAFSPASVAAVLLSTSPVFSLFLEAAVDGSRITPRALLGTLLAVAGVAVLTWPAG